jgi:Domain of unknown function (DUF4260)
VFVLLDFCYNPDMKQHIYLQRAESLVVFVSATYIYFSLHFNLASFILLLFVFDISMIGYIKNARVGAHCYNMIHSFALPVALAVVSHATNAHMLLGFSLIWTAHIGLDRALGYGLKLPSGFTDTHLGKIARPWN